MIYFSECILLVTGDPISFVFPLLKFLFIFLILILFYKYFIKQGILKKNRQNFIGSDQNAKIRIKLLRDKINNPSLINLIIQNTGKKEVELDAPVLVFKRWTRKRKFRILSVDFSEVYPMLIGKGRASVVLIDLEQFYQYSPELRKSKRLSVEMKEMEGRRFKSPTIRLKRW